jgi:hypothetical protein
MTWKSYLLASGAGVVATYLASGPVRHVETVATPRPAAAARGRTAPDIQEQAMRLQSRVRQPVAYREPSRNPFRFSKGRAWPPAVAEAPAAPLPPAAATASEPVAPALPAITLSGIASDEVGGAIQRTAILSTPGGVLLVREGDALGAAYTVGKVLDASVELVAADGTVRRLSFTP